MLPNIVFDIVLSLQPLLGQLAYIAVPYAHVRIAYIELFVGAVVAQYIWHVVVSCIQKPSGMRAYCVQIYSAHSLLVITVLYSLVRAGIYMLYDFHTGLISGLYILRSLGMLLLLVWAVRRTYARGERWSRLMFRAVAYIVPAICLIQYVYMPDMRPLAAFGWDPHLYRAVGLMFDPPITGAILIIVLIASYLQKDWFASILAYLAVIFLYSRGSYIALVCAAAFVLLRRRLWWHFACFLVITYSAITLAPLTISIPQELESAKVLRTSTVYTRLDDITFGIGLLQKNILFGIGQGTLAQEKMHINTTSTKNHAIHAIHNTYLTLAISVGVVGLMLYIATLIYYIHTSEMLVGSLVVVGTIGLFDNVVMHPIVWSMILISYLSVEKLRQRE